MRGRVLGAVVALGAAVAPSAVAACALELILAIDVSGSINSREYALQVGGLADALANPAVSRAVEALDDGMVVTLTHWSGASRQRQMTPWHQVTGEAELAQFAAEVRATTRAWRNFSTAIGEALEHARRISADAPATCARRVIDISGDGVSNEGRPPGTISPPMAASGYTINGLVIRGADPDPVEHFERHVIAGEGAFIEIAEDFDDYPRAILRKLLREIDRPMQVSDAEDR